MFPQSQNWRLGVDGRTLGPKGTGVTGYARALQAAQAALTSQNFTLLDNESVVAARQNRLGRASRWIRAIRGGRRTSRWLTGRALLAEDVFRIAQVYFDIYRELLAITVPGPPGLMHWAYPVPLRIDGWINVYTVHDLIPIQRPDLSPIPAARHKRLLAAICRQADRIVTVSEASRKEIIVGLDVADRFVVNCSQSVEIGPGSSPTSLPAGLQPGGYILTLGTIEPRKNIAGILKAFVSSRTGMRLVIAGPDGWHAETFAAAMASDPRIIRLPYVPQAELMTLIAHAGMLLMPSLAEGFGRPVVEAMMMGVPVITSDRGALQEIAGQGALLVDPESPAAIAAAIDALAASGSLRSRLAEVARANVTQFSHERFVERLSAVYSELLPI